MIAQQWRVFARYLSLSNRPILCGPWRSEVGFEILYWIPFLHKFMQDYGVKPDRLIAIGRGGSAQWYGFAGQADLHEHVPVEVARTWSIQSSQQTGSMKQHREEPWERHVCGLTAHSLGLARYHRLSPSWMYKLLEPYWLGQTSLRWLTDRTLQPVKMHAPKLPIELQTKLPKDFIAMRWYARPTWPFQEGLNLWTRQCVERLAKQHPIVLIDSFHADDHADINPGKIDNVIRLSELATMTALDNLAVQSSVIARAKAYIGTYGGMSQAAMRWGIPTLALYHEFGQTAPEHLHLTNHLSLQTGVPFIACTPKQADGALPMLLGRA